MCASDKRGPMQPSPPSSFAEIVSDDFPGFHLESDRARFGLHGATPK
jgi:hypothetical protein